ncbi:MAG TPA: DUF4349 domain-containing protein [Acidimicrobiales bacterium]|nr:DUF4349 domain-containing protein [Acidimicrobiales bacterium]
MRTWNGIDRLLTRLGRRGFSRTAVLVTAFVLAVLATGVAVAAFAPPPPGPPVPAVSRATEGDHPAQGAGSQSSGTSPGAGGGAGTLSAGAGGTPVPGASGSTASAAGAGSGGGSAGGPGAPSLPPGATGQSARIEETGSLTLLVARSAIGPDIAKLGNLALANGGFVASSGTASSGEGSPAQGSITLQVPQPAFAAVLAQAQGFGKVGDLSSRATDVTGQYVDLQARITALQDSRQQYLTILARASSIGDVLSVQSQLDNLQTQIEQLQGQLQVLDSQTTYASLAVTLTEKLAPPAPVRPASGLAAAWHGALSGFAAGADGLVRLAGPLLFALLVVSALVLGGRWAWHLSRRRLT